MVFSLPRDKASIRLRNLLFVCFTIWAQAKWKIMNCSNWCWWFRICSVFHLFASFVFCRVPALTVPAWTELPALLRTTTTTSSANALQGLKAWNANKVYYDGRCTCPILTLSVLTKKYNHSPNLLLRKCISEVERIGSIIIFHLSKLWKAKFFILCGVIFLVRPQVKFEIDHS